MTEEDQSIGSPWWKKREASIWLEARHTLGSTITWASAREVAPEQFEACAKAGEKAQEERKALQEKGVPFEEWTGPAIKAEEDALRELWSKAGDASDKAIKRFQDWIKTDEGTEELRQLCDLIRGVYDGDNTLREKIQRKAEETARRFIPSVKKNDTVLNLAIDSSRSRALATGQFMTRLGRDIPTQWTTRSLREIGDQGGVKRDPNEPKPERRWIVKLVGGAAFQPELPTMNEPIKDGGTLIAALQRELPEWYTLKIIDACHSLALDDPKKDGGFWYHPAHLMNLLGLRGREEGGRQYTTTSAKKRFQKRLDNLMQLQVEISVETSKYRTGKGWQRSTRSYGKMRLLSEDRAAGTKPVTLHTEPFTLHAGGKGRPVKETRLKVSALTWEESKHHIRLTGAARKFFALQDGAAYKLARYLLIRSRWISSLEHTESLDNIAYHAGLKPEEVINALPHLKPLEIAAGLVQEGYSLQWKLPEDTVDLRRTKQGLMLQAKRKRKKSK